MTTDNEDAIDVLTTRVNNLYRKVFNTHQPADTIKKVKLSHWAFPEIFRKFSVEDNHFQKS